MNQIQIIVNNGAGTGKAFQVWNETQKLLRRYKVNYTAYATRYRGHATRLAEKISTMEGKAQVYLIVVGGDGTINEVLNGIRDFGRVRLGVIPTGSGNDFCRNLKLPGTPGGESATDPGVHPQGPPAKNFCGSIWDRFPGKAAKSPGSSESVQGWDWMLLCVRRHWIPD